MCLPDWAFGPFKKHPTPVVVPDKNATFFCPVQNKQIAWQATNVYNPASIVKDGVLHIFYRADDEARPFLDVWGNPMVTCRIAHATSVDGIHFTTDPTPVIYPDNDEYLPFEWDGGCQDIHIAQDGNGHYFLYYTAWIGSNDHGNSPDFPTPPFVDVLMVASSTDLIHWKKHGPVFQDPSFYNHTRTGVIVSRLQGEQLIAEKINGNYYMYYAHNGWMAVSKDLVHFTPVYDEHGKQKCLFENFTPYPYANVSCEAGAAAILTDKGIVYFFNGAQDTGERSLPWSQGQALVDKNDLCTVLDVLKQPHLSPEYAWETVGHTQTPCLVCNGIVKFLGKWRMYYGASDHVIGLAIEA